MAVQMLRAVIGDRLVWITLDEWEAWRAHGPTDELIRQIMERQP